jgi:WD40 repeat protein
MVLVCLVWAVPTLCRAEAETQAVYSPGGQSNTNPAQLLHTSVIQAVTFSSDGRAVLTFNGAGNVRVWNAVTGKQTPMLNLTFQWGTRRYGVIFLGSITQWMKSSIVVWNGQPHSVPGWLILLIVCFLLAVVAGGANLWFGRRGRNTQGVRADY